MFALKETLPFLLILSVLACKEQGEQRAKHERANAVPASRVTFGQRSDLEPGTKLRITGTTTLRVNVGDATLTKHEYAFDTGYVIDDALRATLSIAKMSEHAQSGSGEPQVSTIEDVTVRVDRSNRHMSRSDGGELPKGMQMVLQGAVGSPTLKELRTALLAGKTIGLGQWQELPDEIFAATPYPGRGFTGGRFEVIEAETDRATLHIEVQGPGKSLELRVAVLLNTLRATRGSVRSRDEAPGNGVTKIHIVESNYENTYL